MLITAPANLTDAVIKKMFLFAVAVASKAVRLSNLALPLDTAGNPLLTGESSVLSYDGAYYLYVNNWGGCADVDCCTTSAGCASCCMRTQPTPDPCVYTNNHTVVVYKTDDLSSWQYLGVALALEHRLRGIVFRPHVVFNAKTQLFVMWYMNRHPAQQGYAIATSKSPSGPFIEVVNSTKMHGPGGRSDNAGDFQILVDDDGAAYHVRDAFVVERLADDYLSGTGVYGVFRPTRESEGPVFFKRDKRYYVITGSACCACKGGSSMDVFVADKPLGPYKSLGDVGSNTSQPYDPHSPTNFITNAQGSSIFVLPAKGGLPAQYVWLGNQWVTSRQAGKARNGDLLYFSNLVFEADGSIRQVEWQDTTVIQWPDDEAASTPRVHGPGTYAHYTSEAALADDVAVYHIWETIPTPSEKEGNAVFASMQYWFENGVGGYFGTQVWREGAIDQLGRIVRANETHRVIFSVWDAPGGQKVGWRGAGCGRFGGEGVGSHCLIPYPLREGDAFYLRVRMDYRNGTGTFWTGSVTDMKGGTAPLDFGSLFLPDVTPGKQGFGRMKTKAAAFQEYFEATGCQGQALSSVGLVGPWWQNNTITPTQAYADYAKNCSFSDVGSCIYGAGCGKLRVLLTAGGATKRKHVNTSEPLW